MDDVTLAKLAHLADDGEAYRFLEAIRWPDGPVCPHCGVIGNAYFLEPKKPRRTRTGKPSYRRLWKCGSCRRQFSVLVGTIFEDSRVPLSKWLLAFHLMCAGKNGVSAHELHRSLEVTYRTAWFMAHRIRYALAHTSFAPLLGGTVEADETYIGGKQPGVRGRGARGKTPVMALVQRDGEARSRALEKVNAESLHKTLKDNMKSDALLITDDFTAYKPASGWYTTERINHSQGQYVQGAIHTNTVEGYFSQLKRSLDGTYHHVSKQHLHRYLSEFDYRYNTRKQSDSSRIVKGIQRTAGKRLMYRDTKD